MDCKPGCKLLRNGERKHIPECVFYNESLSEMYDELVRENKRLKRAIKLVENNFPDSVLDDQMGEDYNTFKKLSK